jgi:hypothetical protein
VSSFGDLNSNQRINGDKTLHELKLVSWLDVNNERWFNLRTGVEKLMEGEDKEVVQALGTSDAIEWHKRYGHLSYKIFSKIKEVSPDLENIFNARLVERIYVDLVMSTESIGGKKYLLNAADDNTRLLFTTGLRRKGDAGDALIEIIDVAERILGHRAQKI